MQQPVRDPLHEPVGTGVLLAERVQRLGGDASSGVPDHPAEVELVENRLGVRHEVDAGEDGVRVDTGEQGVQIDAVENTVEVDTGHDRVRIDAVEDAVQVHPVQHGVQVDARGDAVDVQPVGHRVEVDLVEDGGGDRPYQRSGAQRRLVAGPQPLGRAERAPAGDPPADGVGGTGGHQQAYRGAGARHGDGTGDRQDPRRPAPQLQYEAERRVRCGGGAPGPCVQCPERCRRRPARRDRPAPRPVVPPSRRPPCRW